MKLKYLDIKNCEKLLPRIDFTIGILRQFDLFLDKINSNTDTFGLILKMIEKNDRSLSQNSWNRLYQYDADIGVTINKITNETYFELKPYYKYPELARPKNDQRVVAQFWQIYGNNTRWGYKMPVQCLLKKWGDANTGHKCYLHTIGTGDNELSYAGITKRNWLERLSEHLYEIKTGSRRTFHKIWRESFSLEDVVYGSELIDINATYEIAMAWEEWFVDKYTLYPKGLNMIPGGLKGLQFLYKHRLVTEVNVSLENREAAIAKYVNAYSRKGLPNPFIAELWKNDDYYTRVITSRPKTLCPNQVSRIRELGKMGWPINKIATEVNAINDLQVVNVLRGRTYARIQ